MPREPAWKDAIASLRPLVRHSCLLLLAFKRDVGSDTSQGLGHFPLHEHTQRPKYDCRFQSQDSISLFSRFPMVTKRLPFKCLTRPLCLQLKLVRGSFDVSSRLLLFSYAYPPGIGLFAPCELRVESNSCRPLGINFSVLSGTAHSSLELATEALCESEGASPSAAGRLHFTSCCIVEVALGKSWNDPCLATGSVGLQDLTDFQNYRVV